MLAAIGKGLQTALKFGGAASGGVSSGGNLFPPFTRYLEQSANKQIPNAIPSIPDLISLHRFGVITNAQFLDWCSENGLDATHSMRLFEASQSLLTAGDYVSLSRRGVLEGITINEALTRLGYTAKEIPNLVKATEFVPSVQDIIYLAVKDGFPSAARTEFKLTQDQPKDFAEWAPKIGLDPALAEAFWAAHWSLPSITQGFEMLQRQVITDSQLDLLLKAQDVAPFWREKLKEISYNPLTRVDVRRMRKLGVLSYDEVVKAYRDGGYNKENAARLADFVEADIADDEGGVNQASITKAYKDGLLDASEYTTWLTKRGLKPDAISFLLETADYDKKLERLKPLVNDLIARYAARIVTEDEARSELSGAGAPAAFVDQALAKITAHQSARVKIPTRTDLERWFEKGLIGDAEYFGGMVALGYSSRHAQLYMAEIIHDREDHPRKWLSVKQYQNWLKLEIMTLGEFNATLKEMGVSSSDIDKAAREVLTDGQK